MVDSAANMLLETLRDLLVEEVKFLSEVSNKVKNAEKDLRTIHYLLMEADQNRSRCDSSTFQSCIEELRQLAFTAENVLEDYAFEVESKKEGRSLKEKLRRFMCILCECYSVHRFGNEVEGIRNRLADLTTSLRDFSGGEEGTSNSADQEHMRLLRLRYAHEVEPHFVGMEKDIEFVVSKLEHDSPSHISICGMGGLGKTSLARKIYHHPDVQRRFNSFAWVCVTQQFQAETVLKEIFENIDGKEPDLVGTSALVKGLYKVLVQRKCLIVIDDIWETSHWDILNPAFPRENCKVVLTTRNENIASQEGYVHKLGFLSEDEGWELLGKIALPINMLEDGLELFEDIGRKMVKKCGHLPLSISVIGGILRQKQQTLAEWEKVSSNLDSYLRHGGDGIGNDTRVKLVLDLSFDVLPYHLKPCFLYLACFTEDKVIATEKLYLLWLAEGLISSEEKGHNETWSDVAERYLTELASRCMVQVNKFSFNSPYKKYASCKLHDLLHDLCSLKAERENFVKRVDISEHQHDIPSAIGATTRRLAINLEGRVKHATLRKISVKDLKDVRSFLLSHQLYRTIRASDFQNIVNFENSKHSRILQLDGVVFEDGNLPSTIGKQIHLKYLSLNGCEVEELPQHIWNLQYLQTLMLMEYDYPQYHKKLKMPNLIWKLTRLRRLVLPDDIEVIGGDKLKLDGLNELETLENVNSKSVCIEDIINLMNLRTLRVTIEEDVDRLSKIVDYMSSSVCQLRQIVLSVESCDLRNVLKNILQIRSLNRLRILDCEIGCGFPSYEQGLCPNLFALLIKDSKIGGDVVEGFGKFPMFQSLWLERVFEEEVPAKITFGANSFPELKILHLHHLMNLEIWEVEKGAMPKLERLYIYNCSNLKKLPEGVMFISTLLILRCVYSSEEVKSRMRGGENAGQDYANFSHIPHLDIS